MKYDLSKLKKVNLRSIWAHEAHDFTKWLAEEENLNTLGDEIGIDITLIQTEANVGSFNVDILAEENISQKKIIIENQLEKTDHDHLGKLITYASGYDANIIIWVVKEAREEHKKAIEWLNDNSSEDIGFFLVQIELWQIAESKPAPKFEIICNPNEWAKTIKTTSQNKSSSETELSYFDFWTGFNNFVELNDPDIKLYGPTTKNWKNQSIGFSECHIVFTTSKAKNFIGCELYIKNYDLFFDLESKKEQIENELKAKLNWRSRDKSSIIFIHNQIEDLFDHESLKQKYKWLYDTFHNFKKVFSKHIEAFKKYN